MELKSPASLSNFKTAESDEVPVILVVEDDEDNQLLLEHTITMFGWKHLDANNAIAALNLAKSQQPDLILLDIVLPDITLLCQTPRFQLQ